LRQSIKEFFLIQTQHLPHSFKRTSKKRAIRQSDDE
jgi:hypothetical protein